MSPLFVDRTPIDPVQSVRDLGIFIDADLVMRTHVQRMISRCFAVFRQLRSTWHSVPTATFQTHPLAGTVEAGLRKCLPCTFFADFSRWWTRQHGSSSVCIAQTTSRMPSSPYTGSEPRRGYCSRWPCSCTLHKAAHGATPLYPSQLDRVADLPGRRCLRSARTNLLLVPSVKLSTVGGRAFPVAGPTIWNSLPDNVTSAPSLSTLHQRLKTFLFLASFPDIITDPR